MISLEVSRIEKSANFSYSDLVCINDARIITLIHQLRRQSDIHLTHDIVIITFGLQPVNEILSLFQWHGHECCSSGSGLLQLSQSTEDDHKQLLYMVTGHPRE